VRRLTLLPLSLLLVFAAGNFALLRLAAPTQPPDPPQSADSARLVAEVRPQRNAQAGAAASQRSTWQPAMEPDGSAHPAIQFRWRSDPPCTALGCQLGVEIRNTGNAPLKLRCLVYFDPPPEPYEDAVRPVILEILLNGGKTASPLTVPGISITGVVVERTEPK
jgi:hypothetical protein